MDSLAWFATTPEGEQLGKLAAQMVRTEWTTVPIWLAPIEPFRWFISLMSAGYPHAKWLGLGFSVISFFVALTIFLRLRTTWWHRLASAVVAFLSVLLTLSGGFIFVNWLNAIVPYGIRWVVPKDAPFLLANLHTHTTQSNGFLTPEQAVLWHMRRGYKVVAITDSNTVRGGEIAREFVKEKNLPVTVLVGEEFRGKTHLVLLNISKDISPRDFDVPSAIKEAKRQGGIVIVAHPWTSKHSIEDLAGWGVDGFEIVNGATLGDDKLQTFCKRRKFAVLGNLDFRSDYIPETATVLPRWATTPDKVAEALKGGKCAALYLSNRVGVSEFDLLRSPLKSWFGELKDLWKTGAAANFVGIAFWALVGQLVLRRKRSGTKTNPKTWSQRKFVALLALALALFALSFALGVWSMARDLKQGWFPPLPLVISVWAIVCPINWWLWGQLSRNRECQN